MREIIFYWFIFVYLFVSLQLRVIQYSIISMKNKLSKGTRKEGRKLNKLFFFFGELFPIQVRLHVCIFQVRNEDRPPNFALKEVI